MARPKTLFHAVARAKKVKLVTDKERKLIDNASYLLKRGLDRDAARSMRALDKYDALIGALNEIEVTEIDEAMTSDEMSNLVASLKEFDSYSLVG